MTKEEKFVDILSSVGSTSYSDREAIAHKWFDAYKDELPTMPMDKQREIAKLYTLVRDFNGTLSDTVLSIYTLKLKYELDEEANRLCIAINDVMKTYNGTDEHLYFVWRASGIPSTVDEIYNKIPTSMKTDDKRRDVHNFLTHL